MSEWTDADVERLAKACYERGGGIFWQGEESWRDHYLALACDALASGVVVPARLVEEAERERNNAQRVATMYQREIKGLRSAVEALADDIRRQSRICNVGNTATIADRLAALLTEGRDRAGEGAGS